MAATLDVHDEPSMPARIGEYQILDALGAGGMGVVYAGRQPDIGKRVAVKPASGRSSVALIIALLATVALTSGVTAFTLLRTPGLIEGVVQRVMALLGL